MRYPQTPMPPSPESIMRKATTNRIGRALTDPVTPGPGITPGTMPGPALLGPPVHQPPQIGGTLTPGTIGDAAPVQPINQQPIHLAYEALMRSAGPGIRAAQPMLPPKNNLFADDGGLEPVNPGIGGTLTPGDPFGGHIDPIFGDPMAGHGGPHLPGVPPPNPHPPIRNVPWWQRKQ